MPHQNDSLESLRNGHARPTAVLDDSVDQAGDVDANDSDEVVLLRGENAALQAKVDELEQLLQMAGQEAEERLAERQREYEGLLDEKSEVIRSLHLKINELREQDGRGTAISAEVAGEPPDKQELRQIHLELEEQRRQLKEDEESMMAQLRQMEMALAKDRAELARQRAELQRLHGELKHELETAARDGGLRDRLSALQRRVGTPAAPARLAVNQDTPAPAQLSKAADAQPKSGLFRRIFGSGK